ncbi:hypothetical protein [Noviherbaspirillum massiliense]|uniref:hypothetical protein n=1 Tax=Noviherbaspirillum massiliense TaxID=1465823 RepID=UPI0002F0DCFB|nr:hypothetical protein [Noviherbaspirillum massiliense]
MLTDDFSRLAGQFGMALLPVIVWLLGFRIIPGLRTRLGLAHAIAGVIAVIACLAFIGEPIYIRLAISLFVLAIVYRLWKRTLRRRSMEANTIIRFENRKYF